MGLHTEFLFARRDRFGTAIAQDLRRAG